MDVLESDVGSVLRPRVCDRSPSRRSPASETTIRRRLHVARGFCPGRSHLCSRDLRLSSLRPSTFRHAQSRPEQGRRATQLRASRAGSRGAQIESAPATRGRRSRIVVFCLALFRKAVERPVSANVQRAIGDRRCALAAVPEVVDLQDPPLAPRLDDARLSFLADGVDLPVRRHR